MKLVLVLLILEVFGSYLTAARFALFGLIQTLAQEGAKYNIQVNLITPHCMLCLLTAHCIAY